MPLSRPQMLEGLKAFQGLSGTTENLFNKLNSTALTFATTSLIASLGLMWANMMDNPDIIPETDNGTVAGYLLAASVLTRVTMGFCKGLYSQAFENLPVSWQNSFSPQVMSELATQGVHSLNDSSILSIIAALETLDKQSLFDEDMSTSSSRSVMTILGTTGALAIIGAIDVASLSKQPLNDDVARQHAMGWFSLAGLNLGGHLLYLLETGVETLSELTGGHVKKTALSKWPSLSAAQNSAAIERLAAFEASNMELGFN